MYDPTTGRVPSPEDDPPKLGIEGLLSPLIALASVALVFVFIGGGIYLIATGTNILEGVWIVTMGLTAAIFSSWLFAWPFAFISMGIYLMATGHVGGFLLIAMGLAATIVIVVAANR